MSSYQDGDVERNISDAGRAILVGVEIREERSLFSVEDSLDELLLLVHTAGVEVVGRVIQRLTRPDPATFIGSGKVEEIAQQLAELGAGMVIFDDELSPRHQRELEKAFGEAVQVLDRSALILDIFAQHAQTREGSLQVELAQYEYRLPRLTRQWTHLARQVGGGAARGGSGGVGLRGPGETQLEVDRREIRRKISKLKEELEQVRAHRQRHRSQRSRAGMPTVALVGYTNAGKSTLLNALSGADVYVADQLFATLDPTTRRVKLPSGRIVLLTDTVGFIQKLPVTLAAAFRATLEEVGEADVILHVVDASHPRAVDHIDVVEDTLAEIDATRVPKILVLNKSDLVPDRALDLDIGALGYQEIVHVSALKKAGLQDLLAAVGRVLSASMVEIEQFVPYSEGELISSLYDHGVVLSEEHAAGGVRIKARVPGWLASRLARAD
ncbi:MAG TPA: GTPase HflX [Aggregatilinea sp.]|uniref:GTPase HflX n=1 Tax=Aggregatilinea sp. TaxID=2806333 RepID=UPI002C445D3D|nr:GTPase HflX [Aggregatilinea sp.]HML20144.1 GTPase HflX [Aggregatilinea sp.]